MSTIFANNLKNISGGNNVNINQLSGIDTAGTTDVANSEYVLSFTSPMADDNYVASAMANRLYFVAFRDDESEKTSDISSTSCKFKVNRYDAGAADQRYTGTLFAGDLA